MNFIKFSKNIISILFLISYMIFVNNELSYCQGFHTEQLEYFWELMQSKNIKKIDCYMNYKLDDSVSIASSLKYNKEKNILIFKSYLDQDSSDIFFSTNHKLKKVVLYTENMKSILQFNYDSTKNIESQTSTDVIHIDTVIKYEDGRRKIIFNEGKNKNSESKQKYFYNQNGEIIKIEYPFSSNLEIDFDYDSDGLLVSETWTKNSDDKFCYRFIYKYLF